MFAALYFFWFPSSFPAKTGTTGIEQAEWLWLVGVFIPILVAGFVVQGIVRIPSVRKTPGLLLIPAAYSFLFITVFSGGQISTAVDRADYIPLLLLLIPSMLVRFAMHRRLWTFTPLDLSSLAFILLCLLSTEHAPYPSRGWQMLARPLLGMAIVMVMVEWTRIKPKQDTGGKLTTREGALWIITALGLLIGVMALFSTQWTEKSTDFQWIIDRLPEKDFFFAAGGFNPNEIAGAIAWLAPLIGGLVFYRPARQIIWHSPLHSKPIDGYLWSWRLATGGVFMLLLLALLLGQSRSAIIGVIVALFGVALCAVPRRRWQLMALGMVGVLALLQAAILFNFFPSTNDSAITGGLTARDERSSSQRFALWGTVLDIIQDYPLTGVGMNSFRSSAVREDYPFERAFVPHAHNEFVQVAADLGVPGLVVFMGWNVTAVYMLWVSWRRGDQQAKVVAVAVAAGLLAHAVYGMFDAIPLWDRLNFIYWFLLGLAAAQYQSVEELSING